MFVYSVKASSLKFVCTVALCLLVITALIIYIPQLASDKKSAEVFEPGSEISFENIETNEDRVGFLSSFGWEVKSECTEEKKVTIPAEFDRIYTGYNEIQKSQGLDLSKYQKKEVESFTYQITNYEGYDGEVYATLLIYRGEVIGGDIASANPDGFVQGFARSK